MCGNPARTDVGGGRAAMTVPTALHFETYRVRPKAGRVDEHGNHGVAVGTAYSSSSRFGPSSQALARRTWAAAPCPARQQRTRLRYGLCNLGPTATRRARGPGRACYARIGSDQSTVVQLFHKPAGCSPMPSEFSQRSTCAQELISGTDVYLPRACSLTGDTRPPALAGP